MNKQVIIGLGFRKQVGKTTAALHLAELLKCHVRPMSHILYRTAEAMLGEPIDEIGKRREYHGVTGRKILQSLGDYMKSTFGEHFIVNNSLALHDIMHGKSVVVPDVRFHHEADMLRSHGGKLWLIKRDLEVNFDSHASETNGNHLDWDTTIINTGSVEDFLSAIEHELEKLL